MKKVCLYGAGGYGKAALDAFAEHDCLDMIFAVIDNNPGLKGGSIFGKPILPYSEALNMLTGDVTVIISVELELSISISNQLKKDGVTRYVHWAYEQYEPFEDVVSIVQEDNDYLIFSHSLLREIATLESQRNYLIDHCDPRNMKPATGELRNRQLQLVKFASEINSILNKAEIYPFVSSGNLLGYIRHGGFIPWDDDFDFSMIRSDYIRMRDYLCEHFYYSKYNGPFNDDTAQLKWLKKEMDDHLEEIVILERPMLFRACRKTRDEEYLLVDFFPFDEFAGTTLYEDRLAVLQANKNRLNDVKTVAEYDEIIEQISQEDKKFRKEGGELLGFGCDVRESYTNTRFTKLINRDVVYPLKMAVFEGENFYIPNNPEEYLRYEFDDNFMELPKSIGLHFSPADINKV